MSWIDLPTAGLQKIAAFFEAALIDENARLKRQLVNRDAKKGDEF